MKYLKLYILFFALIISCKQRDNQNTETVESSTVQLNLIDSNNNKGVEFLKEFYMKFYSNYKNEKNIENFVSARFLNRMDSLRAEENLILDYDPFIQAQDWDSSVLIKSLMVKPLKNKNEYRASFLLFNGKEQNRTSIDFVLIEDDKGKYLIDGILNDDFLNFKKSKKDDESTKEKLVDSNNQQTKITGLWRLGCEGDLTTFDINDNQGYLSLYSFNKIYINTTLRQTSNPNEYNLFFKDTAFKQKYYDDYEFIENDNDISTKKPIGKIKIENNGKLLLEWTGLYNEKLKKLQFVNDFLLIRENGGNNPILLEKCE